MAKKKTRDGLRLRNGIWQISYTDRVTGIRQQISADTPIKEKAIQLREKLIAESWEKKNFGNCPDMTVNAIVEWCWNNYWCFKKKANKAIRQVALAIILRKFGGRIAQKITADEFRAYIKARLEGTLAVRKIEGGESVILPAVRKSTIKKEFTHLGCAFNQAVKNNLLRENPLKRIDPSALSEDGLGRQRIATPLEISLLLGHSAGMMNAIIEFDLNSGLRQGQIRELKWTDIDFKRRMMSVACDKGGKSKRYDVPVFKRAMEILLSLPRVSEYVFTNYEGKQIPLNGLLHSSFVRLVERVGIKDFTFHDLRHTFATDYYRKTLKLKAIQKILGHSSARTTETYLNLKDEDLHLLNDYTMDCKVGDELVTQELDKSENLTKTID